MSKYGYVLETCRQLSAEEKAKLIVDLLLDNVREEAEKRNLLADDKTLKLAANIANNIIDSAIPEIIEAKQKN